LDKMVGEPASAFAAAKGQQIRSNAGADGDSPDERRRLYARHPPCVGLEALGRSRHRSAENARVHELQIRRLAARRALMFTGIIQATGQVARSEPRGGDWRISIAATGFEASAVALGDSIAVSGCCLTVVAREGDTLTFDVSNETLSLTTLGSLRAGDAVNLEKALRLSDRLGGHLVSGHVDGLGSLIAMDADARSLRWRIEAPTALRRYIAAKGSVCVEGVSLTVNAVDAATFEVNLIPHTVAHTTLRDRRIGDRVNLEIDLLARYVERLLATEEH
jgi:riboflavin synthase